MRQRLSIGEQFWRGNAPLIQIVALQPRRRRAPTVAQIGAIPSVIRVLPGGHSACPEATCISLIGRTRNTLPGMACRSRLIAGQPSEGVPRCRFSQPFGGLGSQLIGGPASGRASEMREPAAEPPELVALQNRVGTAALP